MSLRLSLLLALVATLGWGCGSGAKNPPDGAIWVFHAAPSQGGVRFLRVERAEANLNYKESSAVLRVDTDSYRFSVDVLTPTGSDRVLSFTRTIEIDTEYDFIVYDSAGGLAVREFEQPFSEVPASGESEVQLVHVAAGVGAVDVYLEAPGIDPIAVMPWGSVPYAERIDPEIRPAGEYQLTFTEPNQPGNVLFRSTAFTVDGGASVRFLVVAGAGSGTAPLSVVVATSNGVAGELFDEAQQPALRTLHAARTAGPLNVVVDGQFGTPLFSDVTFRDVTDYATIPAGEFNLTVTPSDNPGVLEVDRPFQVGAGSAATLYLLGEPGALSAVSIVDDNRSLADAARLRLISQAIALGIIDLYLVAPGTDVSTVAATIRALSPGASTGYQLFAEGEYDLVITAFGGSTPVYGPLRIQLNNGGVYGALVIDGVDSGTADVLFTDDFLP